MHFLQDVLLTKPLNFSFSTQGVLPPNKYFIKFIAGSSKTIIIACNLVEFFLQYTLVKKAELSKYFSSFDVLLTVHLSKILVTDQLNAQIPVL